MKPDLLVIPCYNEEHRLPHELALRLLDDPRLEVLFVNDGSTDKTSEVIARLVEEGGGRFHGLDLPQNSGKAEAVRQGLLWGIARGARCVGYADADFATPPGELIRLLDGLEAQRLGAVLGCRVARLGAHISRRFTRHLVSRVFATVASAVLGVNVYDTQCGAKWFLVNAAIEGALAQRFESRWAFDVELLGRLLGRWGNGPRLEHEDVLEIPIRAWRDVGGSKVSLRGMVKAIADMFRMMLVAARLGPDHPKTLAVVPVVPLAPHPRTSWAPKAVAGPGGDAPEQSRRVGKPSPRLVAVNGDAPPPPVAARRSSNLQHSGASVTATPSLGSTGARAK